ncbi:type II secretion system protein J (GspJ) [Sphingomonas laterariae]|uniref:Type II secretion system protein J n=1 Tax=Edaphosphingomonas laterariae TaxID=861865 RepID=A0A239B9B0_9SPHN|nr:type II secretion system minor pseudopilin GspJ [Sphingomonas laterariae]SNS04537.1 type II secretion system protein J (GspJ) [Sphingomonas laterariae]
MNEHRGEHGSDFTRRSAEHGFDLTQRSAEHGFTPVRRSAEHGFTPVRRSAEHGFTPVRRSAEHGFTLVELMISLLIFGMLAAAGVGLLGFSVRAQEAAQERLDEVAAIRRVGAILTSDLAQAAPRLVRDQDGIRQVAFIGDGGAADAIALNFVRRGWSNGAMAARASLQRVEYRLAGDRLERRTWPMLDGAAPAKPAIVMRGVEAMTVRYRRKGEWRDRWDSVRPEAMPDAVEMVLDVAGIGAVRMLFLTGTGVGP